MSGSSGGSSYSVTGNETPLEELDGREISLFDIVGRGTYGTVRKGTWRGKDVAVKIIEGDMARRSFLVESYQLSRIKHENIITLYGACTKSNPVCLVMEYAACGSLHKILHALPKVVYKAAHAMSWMLQCAKGVEYLHNFESKAILHRDLKPLNLLLLDHGRKLKICDFGTACNLQTHMTNNKGSAQWMAPEVFQGVKYNEKCDVFSWAIMLWEVLARRKPFAEVGGNAYSVLWAVHMGVRPPLITNCPKPIEILMTKSWDQSPSVRPSMSEIVKRMSQLMKFFKGADEPLLGIEESQVYVGDGWEPYSLTVSGMTSLGTTVPGGSAAEDTAGRIGEAIVTLPALPASIREQRTNVQQPASASLTSSDENIFMSSEPADGAMRGTEVDHVQDHHLRTDSDAVARATDSAKPLLPAELTRNADVAGNFKEPTDSFRLSLPSVSSRLADDVSSGEIDSGGSLVYLALDAQFQPLRPFPGSRESSLIFLEHCQLAEEYIKIQEEMTLLLKRKQDLIAELSHNIKEAHQTSRYQEYQQHLKEKEQMQELHRTLKADLEAERRQRQA